MKSLYRTINTETKVIDPKMGIVEYIASDQTIDSYREVIMASGWRFDQFQKNSPFVDSHDYSTIGKCLGKVIDFKVQGDKLVETVQWAIDVPQNEMARYGYDMTSAGYLKAVSVGFMPVRTATKWDNDPTSWQECLKKLNLHEEDGVRCIYLEQQQNELSACLIGANPNALARAYKAGIINDDALEKISHEYAKRSNASAPDGPVADAKARQRARVAFLMRMSAAINKI